MVSHHPAEFGEHRDCGSSRDIFLVVEGHVNTPNIGHTHLEQQYNKNNTGTTFASSARFAVEKKTKVENNDKCKALCFTCEGNK